MMVTNFANQIFTSPMVI